MCLYHHNPVNPPKCNDLDYINFLIAAQKAFTCTEASRSQPECDAGGSLPAHDAFTRLLGRFSKDSLWNEARQLIRMDDGGGDNGVLVMDDTTLDKPYSEKIELVTYHWSGKHHRVVKGINLITTLWTNGKRLIPCDFRVYDKPLGEEGPFEGKGKNEHFREMLIKARERGLKPGYVLFDSWYSGLDNLKLIRRLGWHWFTRMKSNRLVNPDDEGNVPVSRIKIPAAEGRVVHLKGYGFIRVFRTVSNNGDVEYYATDDTNMGADKCEELADHAWGIEVYHRGIKQCCGVERSQVRKAVKQISHIMLSLRAFLRLEVHRLMKGISWYETKISIIRGAISSYLANPILSLNPIASA
ncbi:MAG: transposase [Thaumarchaeota archaeon]|nr:transposase [Nitrososphaerota archaeon]